MLEPFSLPFVQRGIAEILLLAAGAGVLGTWVVLRGLSFYAHGVAVATFPGLVLAAGLGFSGPLGALACGVAFALGVGGLGRGRPDGEHGTLTAMVLVGALAVGVILASDVFPHEASVNSLLFGSLLLIDDGDLVVAGAVSVVVLVVALLLGPRWLTAGFAGPHATALGLRSGVPTMALLLLVAAVAVASLSALGSLLAAALLVVPAATVRPWVARMPTWQLATVLLTALVGVVGLWLSARTNAPPGATIAVLTGGLFAMSHTAHALRRRRRDHGPGRPTTRPGRRAVGIGLALVAALGISACGDDGGGDDDRLRVVATTSMVGDLVRNVGGDRVDLHTIIAPGTDPHEFEPRPDDVIATSRAKVVVASGLGLDGWIDDVRRQAGSDAPLAKLGDDVPHHREGGGHDHDHGGGEDDHAVDDHDHAADGHADHDHADDHADGDHAGHDHESGTDPHWWQDPTNVPTAVRAIRDALVRADPDHRDHYARSADAYLAKVGALDRGIRACLADVPAKDRRIVTSHDAFGYFAERYGITVVGAVIPAQTTQAQPSAADVDRLTKLVRSEGVKAIFPESAVSPKLAEALAKATGATADRTLYGDALGDPGSAGGTYLGAMAHNADAIVGGITGERRGCEIAGL
ncbi:MAG: zinc ABC transporter substrate-binding protein [Solirubrobacteraceae bacterium]|nr:zinc ABC transporter substrate-binding protein [Solirubrobacteraceae bacterium]